MALDPKTLRKLFAAGAILAVLIAVGFYAYNLAKLRKAARSRVPRNIPEGVAQSAQGFTYSHSEGGKTIFTIHAANFRQYKEDGRAEMHDVSIIVYGREQDRSDQIYGSDFQYDPRTGDVSAVGEVHIDLQAASTSGAVNQTPDQETKNLIHVKTSGLTFNRNTGLASTSSKIEFRIPEASGSAIGATYDSHGSVLVLKSAVNVVSTDKQKVSVNGQSATITKDPRKIVLQMAKVESPPRTITADRVTVLLRDDNTVARVLGSGNLHIVQAGQKGFEARAPEGEILMAGTNQLRTGSLSGGVEFTGQGESPSQGKAARVLVSFGAQNQVTKARAEGGVDFSQKGPSRTQQILAPAVDVVVSGGKKVERAITSGGPAQLVLAEKSATNKITAGQFEAKFNSQNRVSSVVGSSGTKLVTTTPGQPDRATTSQDLTASFDEKGEISGAEQSGDFRYQEGQRSAWAEKARYAPAGEMFFLSGSPRIVDSGITITADTLQISRSSGTAIAQGNVKSTYTDLKAQPNGAMLASSDPIHVTGTTATANRGTGVAHYTSARLWQGSNIIQAPGITFDKPHRSLQAQGDESGRVSAVFVSPADKNRKAAPVNVTSDKLTYVDNDRKAVFSGNVVLRSEETTITAETVQALLLPRGSGSDLQAGNRLDRIVAQGDIQIEQKNRKATGARLVYTAAEEKFVLTGSPGHRPSIFDAEHGQISGDSLTFFSHDGRVLIGGGERTQPSTETRIQGASAK